MTTVQRTSKQIPNSIEIETNLEQKPQPLKPILKFRKGKDLCLHRKFVPERVDRHAMTHEEYANFLAQPKWSRSPWFMYQKKQEDPEYQRKKLKKVYCKFIENGESYGVKESRTQKYTTDRSKIFFLMKAIKYVPSAKGKKKKKSLSNKSGTLAL
ncbi:uncharacterized protein LOC106663858 [Cimex lectularius]|uniref:Uncharacterized protein n=1 Tax=Cimex lectularius TaxID=79782 RepID=A0A8I6STH0_CIMLE|nr:uncharacterized protein LOC106663858 [Cimex lectularius]XP_024085534.1 uncharacterized protein LOC106663858 [Cimex lectularius]